MISDVREALALSEHVFSLDSLTVALPQMNSLSDSPRNMTLADPDGMLSALQSAIYGPGEATAELLRRIGIEEP
jgi:hypothetical protein